MRGALSPVCAPPHATWRSALRRLSAADAQSKHDLAAQIALLQANRAQLYRSILAEIGSTAKRVAHERHFSGIEFVADRANSGGLDLTPLVESRLKQKW